MSDNQENEVREEDFSTTELAEEKSEDLTSPTENIPKSVDEPEQPSDTPQIEQNKIETEVAEEESKEQPTEEKRAQTSVPAEKPKEETISQTTSQTKEKETPQSSSGNSPFPVSLGFKNQKPVSDLTLTDIVLWRNIYATLFLFITGQALHLLLTRYNFSVLTLFGRVVLIHVVLSFLYAIGYKIVKNTTDKSGLPFADFSVDQKALEPFVNYLAEKIGGIFAYYVDILACKDFKKTFKFAVAVQILCWIGKLMSGITFLYLAFNLSFTVPLLYNYKKKEIDSFLDLATAKTQHIMDIVASKIPKSTSVKSKSE